MAATLASGSKPFHARATGAAVSGLRLDLCASRPHHARQLKLLV
jgi:hypothetical protein